MKKLILLMIILSVVSVIFAAGKTLEIIAQETAKEGETLFAQKKFVEAGEKFQEAIEKYNEFVTKNDIPEDKTIIEKWLKNAKISYQNGKAWEKMIAVLDIYIERHPRIYKNYSTKALIYKKYMNPKNYEAAIDAYVSFDETVKPYYKARVKVADIYYNNLEDYENALVWYKKANELKSTSKILNLTSKTYLKLKRNKEAIAVLKEYISTNPSSKEKFNSYYNLGTIYMNDLGNVTEALANYENAVSFKFDKNVTLFMIENYFQQGNFAKVDKHISTFLTQYPNNKDVTYYRALVNYTKAERVKDDKPAAAKSLYQKALNDFKVIPLTTTHGSDAKTKIGYIEKLLKQL